MKFKTLLGAALLASSMLAAGAANAKSLVYCSEGSPENFTPSINTTGTSFDAARPVYNRLVQFTPGTSTDILARVVAQKMSADWGQQVVVENRPGAGLSVGAELVARAAPDGYTLIMSGTDAYSRYPALYPNAKFVSAQFVPVAPTAIVNFVLMGRPGLPAKNLPELLALAKKQQLSFSSWGNGSAGHVAMAQFNLVAKTEMLHVPYRGSAAAIRDYPVVLGYDIAGKYADAAAFKADLVILCIGENVAALKTPEAQAKYQEQVTALLKTLKSNPQAQIIVRSSFWANTAKDTAMRQACEAVGGTFVDISALSKDEKNYARSERPYKHAGVANHPGDRGMAAIAEEIVKAVK